MKGITPRQKLFCDYYLSNGGNGTQAAISAGYKANNAANQASRLLDIDYISKYIKQEQDKLREKLNWTKEEAYKKLKELLNIVDLSNRSERGDYIRALQELNKLFGSYEPEKQEITHKEFKFKMNIEDKEDDNK